MDRLEKIEAYFWHDGEVSEDNAAWLINQVKQLTAALTTARQENERLKGELKEAREGLAVRVHRNLNTDIDALVSENATLRAAVKGKTFFHSDEEVNAEMGRLRAELDALSSICTGEVKAPSYASVVKELHLTRMALEGERERCAKVARAQAKSIRRCNTYRGRVNNDAEQAAIWCEQIAAEIEKSTITL